MRLLALLLMITASAVAQNLTGAWKLVSAGEWRPNGEMLHPYGKNPTGQLLYDGKGQVSLQVQGDTYFAWFGTYKMDQTNGTAYHVVKGSTMEKLRGTTVTCFVTMDGDRLTLGLLPDVVNGEMRLRSLVWERIPQPDIVVRMAISRRTAILSAASYTRVLGANDRIQAGLIGCGNLGMRHLRIYQKPMVDENKVRFAAISDIYTGAKRRAQQHTGIEDKHVHHDYHELIARQDLDAIFVVTPEHWHHRMTLDALRAGKDVYLEKPMAFTIAEAKEIAEETAKSGRVLQIGAQWCSDPRYHLAREVFERGLTGNILWAQSTYSMNSVYGLWQYEVEKEASAQTVDWPRFLGPAPKRPYSGERFFRWRKYWDYSNGVVSDFFYHRLAPLLVTLGGRFPRVVSANGGIYQVKDREVPETFTMTAEYDSFFINIASSAASAGPERHHGPAIYGHEATISFHDGFIQVTPDRQFRKKFEQAAGKPALQIEALPKDLNVIRINHARNFYECMRTRKQPILHAELGYQVMTAIKLAADSYRQRRMMAFDPHTQRQLAEAPPRPGYEGTGENYTEPA